MPKLLVVEDNELSLDILVRRLQRKGFTVSTAKDGNQAVAKAGSEAPDLILMDISLPGMDGLEATLRLKTAPETRSTPIIALTAHAMAGDQEKVQEHGCDDYETKPVDFGRLLGKIEAALA